MLIAKYFRNDALSWTLDSSIKDKSRTVENMQIKSFFE